MRVWAVLIAFVLIFLSVPVFANTTSVYGRITAVDPIYTDVVVDEPRSYCHTVEVPVYGRTQARPENVIAGAIIGGVIGNQFGNGSGQDLATVLGAIIGADHASRNGQHVVTGYRLEQQCRTEYVRHLRPEVSGWRVYYRWNDVTGNFVTNRDDYRVGDRIHLNVTVH
jgi:uncharacterized protein YcfJ